MALKSGEKIESDNGDSSDDDVDSVSSCEKEAKGIYKYIIKH